MTGDQGFGGSGSGEDPFSEDPPRYGPPSYGANPYGRDLSQPGQLPYAPPGMMASAVDRDRALDVLRAAYGEERLTKQEFDRRAAQVLSARHYGDLAPVVSDLPGGSAFGQAPAYPQPGYYMATRAPTNGLAVGTLVCSLCGFIPPATIAAIIMGHVSRRQIRLGGQRGDGFAVAGLVIGYLGASIWALIFLIVLIATSHG